MGNKEISNYTKNIMKKLITILCFIFTVVIVFNFSFAITQGISYTRSLLMEKTPEESVLILADKIDEVDAKIDNELSNFVLDFRTQNSQLVEKITTVENSLNIVSQQAQQQEVQPEPIFALTIEPIRKLHISENYWISMRDNILDETMKDERTMSIRFESIGDSPVKIKSLTFEVMGNFPAGAVSAIKVLTGANQLLGRAEYPYAGNSGKSITVIVGPNKQWLEIPIGERRDYIMAVEMADDLRFAEGTTFELHLVGIESDMTTTSLFSTPYVSRIFTIHSIVN